MTINEQHRVSTGRDDESGSPQSSHALVDRLTAGEPTPSPSAGQRLAGDVGGTWSSAGIEAELSDAGGEAELLLEPVARELIVVRPIGFQPMQWVRALAAEETVPSAKHLTSAAVSVPGVLLTQMAAERALSRQGMDLAETPAGRRRRALRRACWPSALAAKGPRTSSCSRWPS